MCCEGGSRAHHGNGDCSCSPGSGSPGTLTRRFSTQEEQVGALEEYLKDLRAEIQAAEERLATLKDQ
jgi:hypothetical protein